MFSGRVDSFLYEAEKKISLPLTAIVTGFVLLLCSMLYTSPVFEVRFHGIGYSEISADPFNFSSDRALQYRILAPLLGYIFFLRGELFFLLPLLFGALFGAAIYFSFRKKEFSPFESLLTASFMAFSCTILIPLVSPGYTDTVSYFFLFLAFFSGKSMEGLKRISLAAFYFLAAVFNHESNFFLLPSLLFYSVNGAFKNKPGIAVWIKSILIFLMILSPYFIFRYIILSDVKVQYSTDFYFTNDNLKICLDALQWAPAGLFFAFKLLWFFPLYIMWKSIKSKNKMMMAAIFSILFFTLLQLVIAYDVTRMLCLAFPAVLIAAEETRKLWGKEKFISFSLKLMAFNMLILPYFVSKDGLNPILPFFIQKIIDLKSIFMA